MSGSGSQAVSDPARKAADRQDNHIDREPAAPETPLPLNVSVDAALRGGSAGLAVSNAGTIVALQRQAGNRAVAGFLADHPTAGVQRQPAPPPAAPPVPGSSPTWDSLNAEISSLLAEFVSLNANGVASGERSDLTAQLNQLLLETGDPGAKTETELRSVRSKLQAFKQERIEENKAARESWPVIDQDYQAERTRLAASTATSDRKALAYLETSRAKAKARLDAAGRRARWFDISDHADVLATERHLTRGIEYAEQEAVDQPEGDEKKLKTWPWPEFKASQLFTEGAATGVNAAQKVLILRDLRTAIRHNVFSAMKTARELGESRAQARAWGRSAIQRADDAAEKLVKHMHAGSKLGARLHIAGRLTIVVDVGASLVDIFMSPPKDRPKKIVVHASRIAGGLAGAGVGGRWGAKAGARFGVAGVAIGGFLGAVGGGFVGAMAAKKISTFVVDSIWPPDDTRLEMDKP